MRRVLPHLHCRMESVAGDRGTGDKDDNGRQRTATDDNGRHGRIWTDMDGMDDMAVRTHGPPPSKSSKSSKSSKRARARPAPRLRGSVSPAVPLADNAQRYCAYAVVCSTHG